LWKFPERKFVGTISYLSLVGISSNVPLQCSREQSWFWGQGKGMTWPNVVWNRFANMISYKHVVGNSPKLWLWCSWAQRFSTRCQWHFLMVVMSLVVSSSEHKCLERSSLKWQNMLNETLKLRLVFNKNPSNWCLGLGWQWNCFENIWMK